MTNESAFDLPFFFFPLAEPEGSGVALKSRLRRYSSRAMADSSSGALALGGGLLRRRFLGGFLRRLRRGLGGSLLGGPGRRLLGGLAGTLVEAAFQHGHQVHHLGAARLGLGDRR